MCSALPNVMATNEQRKQEHCFPQSGRHDAWQSRRGLILLTENFLARIVEKIMAKIFGVYMSVHEHASTHKLSDVLKSKVMLRLIFALVVSAILVLAMFATSAH
jgi:hypothetical protein